MVRYKLKVNDGQMTVKFLMHYLRNHEAKKNCYKNCIAICVCPTLKSDYSANNFKSDKIKSTKHFEINIPRWEDGLWNLEK